MHNVFNKKYVKGKYSRDGQLARLKSEASQRARNVRDTNANKLLRENQQAMATKLEGLVDPYYKEALVAAEQATEESTLPPLSSK